MLKSLFVGALLAGGIAGLLTAALQIAMITPLIVEAEGYETGAVIHFAGVAEHASDHHGEDAGAPDSDHAHGAEGHEQAGDHGHTHGGGDEPLRDVYTVLTTVLTFCGFGLVLSAVAVAAEQAALTRIDMREGLLFGLAGFASVNLATAAGLPPELPGSAAAGLAVRQAWWIAAALATAGGLFTLAFGVGAARLIGVILIAGPHLVGAPYPENYTGLAPPEIAAEFTARVLAVNAVGWAVLGLAVAWFWNKEDQR